MAVSDFELSGPTFPGEEVYATCIDTRSGSTRLFTGSVSNHWGPVLRRSDDLGATWTEDERAALRFPEGTDASLARIWQLAPGPRDEPDVMYAGVEPAALFRSDDGGRSFSLVRGLWDHPHRVQWQPGGGGLCLHTILVHPDDPDRLLIAISAAGVYLSDDGGDVVAREQPWDHPRVPPRGRGPRVRTVRAQGRTRRGRSRAALPAAPRRHLPQRRRWRELVRDDRASPGWTSASPSSPTRRVPRRRTCCRSRATVPVHSRRSLHRVAHHRRRRVVDSRSPPGCPQRDAHLTVLRDGFTTDGQDPAGLYLGTRTGEVYASTDDGDSWRLLAEHLPPVMSVRAAPVAV